MTEEIKGIKDFGDFTIVEKKKFFGRKISTFDLHDKPIIVEYFEVGDSKKKVGTLCTTIQIIFEEKQRVIFTSSFGLREALLQLTYNCFPFHVKIVKIHPDQEHLKFVKVTGN